MINQLAIATALPEGRVWGSPIEVEVRRRIQISVYAYAYELADNPLADDYEFDRLASLINRQQGTMHPLLDEFFLTQFTPMTGMWIHEHPDLAGIKRVYDRYWAACGAMFPKRR